MGRNRLMENVQMSESQPFVVYGASGSGSVPIEAVLELLGLPYRLEEHEPWKGSAETERLTAINPMAQVPAVRLPSGEVVTESAAILIWLADRYPEGRLALDDRRFFGHLCALLGYRQSIARARRRGRA
jgi:glutathione S-transferase